MHIAIIIPARFASTRLPGKPLIEIAGTSMIRRVIAIAQRAANEILSKTPDARVDVVVATDDQRIVDHLADTDVQIVMTPESCPTGSDRVHEAVKELSSQPDFVINLQGDAPLTPYWFLTEMIEAFNANPSVEAMTVATQLTWDQLDILRENKKTTPFSGTTVTIDPQGDAHWFSKNIIPAIRKEEKHREANDMSPVRRHIGLYGYTPSFLARFVETPETEYEKLEGLEQLRCLAMGVKMRVVDVD